MATGSEFRPKQAGDREKAKGVAPKKRYAWERLKLLTQPKLAIIDEIGYIPIDRRGANLFFQLISYGTTQPAPTTTISTRRFCWRPALVALEATGCVAPYPLVAT